MSSKHDQDDAPILLETPHVGGVAAPDPVEQVLESVRIPVTGSVPSLPQLATATVVAFDVATDALTLRVGGVEVPASRDASVHPIVLEGAAARGERVLIERKRRRTSELSRAAAEGNLSLALALRSAMLEAQRRSAVEREEEGLDEYVALRARLQEALDPDRVLAEVGVTREEWEAQNRSWSRRAMEDRELATLIHERLVAEKRRLRRRRDVELAERSRS